MYGSKSTRLDCIRRYGEERAQDASCRAAALRWSIVIGSCTIDMSLFEFRFFLMTYHSKVHNYVSKYILKDLCQARCRTTKKGRWKQERMGGCLRYPMIG